MYGVYSTIHVCMELLTMAKKYDTRPVRYFNKSMFAVSTVLVYCYFNKEEMLIVIMKTKIIQFISLILYLELKFLTR